MYHSIYRSYVLAIHGSPLWFYSGEIDTAELYGFFSYFKEDGGKFYRTLQSNPSIEQTIDSLGGISRISDMNFDIVFPEQSDFLKFYAVNRITGFYSKITSPLRMQSMTISFEDGTMFTEGDMVCFPSETIKLGSKINDNKFNIQTRSMFPCFMQGRYPTYQKSNFFNGYYYAPEACIDGHWSHNGKFVCLYSIDSKTDGTYENPRLLYVGQVNGIKIQGLQATFETKSITTLLEENEVVKNLYGTVVPNNSIVAPSNLNIYRTDGKLLINIPMGTNCVLRDYTKSFIETSSDWNNSPSVFFGNGNLLTLRSIQGAFSNSNHLINGESLDGSSEWFSDFFNLSKSGGFIKSYTNPTYYEIIYSGDSISRYDYVIGIGTDMRLSNIDTSFFIDGDIVYLKVSNNDNYRPRIRIYKAMFQSGSFQLQEAYNEQFQLLNQHEGGMAIDTQKATVSYVINIGNGTDLSTAIIGLLVSTGEGINQGELATLNYYTSLALPDYIIDFSSFVNIGNPVTIVTSGGEKLGSIIEAPLKITGYCLVFDNGKLTLKRNGIIDNSKVISADASNFVLEKIESNVSYYAPLNIINIEYKNKETKYIVNMGDTSGQLGVGNSVTLQDNISDDVFPSVISNAYQYLYWLSSITPSIVIKSKNKLFGQCDVVSITHPYTVDRNGFGTETNQGLVVSESISDVFSYRILIIGNASYNSILSPVEIVESLNVQNNFVVFKNDTVYKPTSNLSIRNIFLSRNIPITNVALTFFTNVWYLQITGTLSYNTSMQREIFTISSNDMGLLSSLSNAGGIFATVCIFKYEEDML